MEEHEPQHTVDESEPELLYHYTNQAGLLGIIKENCIWATHSQYLNDSSESKILVESIKKILENNETAKAEWNQLNLSFEAIKKRNAYVASFSAGENSDPFDGDSLAMWRAYSDDSGRYSIGFDKKQLEVLARSQRVQGKPDGFLLKCFYLYPDDAYTDELTKDISDYLSSTKQDSDDIPPAAIAARIKHKGFQMENEWRIIFADEGRAFSGGEVLSGKVEFRQGKSQIVPYIRVKWEETNTSKLIKRIVIGPTPNKEDAVKSVKMLLKKQGIQITGDVDQSPCFGIGGQGTQFTSKSVPDGVEVVPSKIPYRNW